MTGSCLRVVVLFAATVSLGSAFLPPGVTRLDARHAGLSCRRSAAGAGHLARQVLRHVPMPTVVQCWCCAGEDRGTDISAWQGVVRVAPITSISSRAQAGEHSSAFHVALP